MQTSNKKRTSWFTFYIVFFLSALFAIWFNQDSIEMYWQQQYHQSSPLAGLQKYSWWKKGSQWREKFNTDEESSEENIVAETAVDVDTSVVVNNEKSTPAGATGQDEGTAINHDDVSADEVRADVVVPNDETSSVNVVVETTVGNDTESAEAVIVNNYDTPADNENSEHDTEAQVATSTEVVPDDIEPAEDGDKTTVTHPATANAEKVNETASLDLGEKESRADGAPDDKISPEEHPVSAAENSQVSDKVVLSAGDNVLFVGDSMMQSFAPHMQKWLKNNYNINSLNMGRHSTGLTNQIYFDWPEKAESSFAEHGNLKLVVVMLGANDPWNIETKQRKILTFKTPAWDEEYGNRMLRIVAAARQQNAQVIWIGLPYMRIKKYNKKIVYIDDLMKKTLENHAIYIPIRDLLSDKGAYQDTMNVSGQWVRLRHKDGIHLNTPAELLILDAVKPHLKLE